MRALLLCARPRLPRAAAPALVARGCFGSATAIAPAVLEPVQIGLRNLRKAAERSSVEGCAQLVEAALQSAQAVQKAVELAGTKLELDSARVTDATMRALSHIAAEPTPDDADEALAALEQLWRAVQPYAVTKHVELVQTGFAAAAAALSRGEAIAAGEDPVARLRLVVEHARSNEEITAGLRAVRAVPVDARMLNVLRAATSKIAAAAGAPKAADTLEMIHSCFKRHEIALASTADRARFLQAWTQAAVVVLHATLQTPAAAAPTTDAAAAVHDSMRVADSLCLSLLQVERAAASTSSACLPDVLEAIARLPAALQAAPSAGRAQRGLQAAYNLVRRHVSQLTREQYLTLLRAVAAAADACFAVTEAAATSRRAALLQLRKDLKFVRTLSKTRDMREQAKEPPIPLPPADDSGAAGHWPSGLAPLGSAHMRPGAAGALVAAGGDEPALALLLHAADTGGTAQSEPPDAASSHHHVAAHRPADPAILAAFTAALERFYVEAKHTNMEAAVINGIAEWLTGLVAAAAKLAVVDVVRAGMPTAAAGAGIDAPGDIATALLAASHDAGAGSSALGTAASRTASVPPTGAGAIIFGSSASGYGMGKGAVKYGCKRSDVDAAVLLAPGVASVLSGSARPPASVAAASALARKAAAKAAEVANGLDKRATAPMPPQRGVPVQPDGMRRLFQRLHEALEGAGQCLSTQPIPHARVPLIKIQHSSGCEIDLAFAVAHVASTHAAMLKTYAALDARVPQLVFAIKRWARAHGVLGAAAGFLPSYAWSVMVIFYLQQLGILPSLQDPELLLEYRDARPQQHAAPRGHDSIAGGGSLPLQSLHAPSTQSPVFVGDAPFAAAWWSRQRMIEPVPTAEAAESVASLGATTRDTIASLGSGALLVGFFRYWRAVAGPESPAASMRCGEFISRAVFTAKAMPLCIEDPCDPSADLVAGRGADCMKKTMQCIAAAADLLDARVAAGCERPASDDVFEALCRPRS